MIATVFGRLNVLAFCTVVFTVVSGCSQEKGIALGAPIPKDVAMVKLSDVIADPLKYNGNTIAMKGIIFGQCPSLCEFFFKDGVHQATIFPQGYKFPKLPAGKVVTVLANVTSGSENIVFSALGIKIEQE